MSDPGDAERQRLADPAWQDWGPYLAERAWGTVREDYSADGDAWSFFPHDHARSRTYRWSEDGLAGICDRDQTLCLSLALWNGVDPILKERAFGLTGPEGNHGEDVKELWWYADSTPTHSWMVWRYLYPQRAFPYDDLVATNAGRTRLQPEYELADTGVLDDDRFFDVTATYAKAGPVDWCVRLEVRNAGPDPATIHLLPTLWWRDRWSWGERVARPTIGTPAAGVLTAEAGPGDPVAPPTMTLIGQVTGEAGPDALFCDNATNTERLWGDPGPAYPKDGINDHVVHGSPTVNPGLTGTKAALHYTLEIAPGATAEVRLRLSPDGQSPDGVDEVLAARAGEADAFYAGLTAGPNGPRSPEATALLRQAWAGMLWSKEFYHFDVATWLDGDPGQPSPPPGRPWIRNGAWRTLRAHDVMSMPDAWEYPWFAAWDLAFHCFTLAEVDPAFAKQQLALIVGSRFQHPNGAVPAYEWDFGAVNPPVHARAALHVFAHDGSRDHVWLEKVFHRLLVNYGWWTNREDLTGEGLFGGGFLGMDNVGVFDRSHSVPEGYVYQQADGTGWMAMYTLDLMMMAAELAVVSPAYEDLALMFLENVAITARAMNDQGLWDEADGFYYDRLVRAGDGTPWPVRARTMTGVVPLFAEAVLTPEIAARVPRLRLEIGRFLQTHPDLDGQTGAGTSADGNLHLALVDDVRRRRILARLLDPAEFLGAGGIRSVSAAYRDQPFVLQVGQGVQGRLDYEPAESTTAMFGGNSNWRGPVWLPMNYLFIESCRHLDRAYGATLTVECPVGSGRMLTLAQVADEIAGRLTGLRLAEPGLAEPGLAEPGLAEPGLAGRLLFHEYFDGDTGAGLGASHQTGWTGLLANVLLGMTPPP